MKSFTTETITEEIKHLESITCDVCKKTYWEATKPFEVQEFQSIRVSGGYGSEFGDGNVYELDICQNCLKEKLGEYFRIVDCIY